MKRILPLHAQNLPLQRIATRGVKLLVSVFSLVLLKCTILTSVKLDEFLHLAGGDVDLHGVVDLDQGVGVADGAAVVGGDVRHVLGPGGNLAHTAQLVLRKEGQNIKTHS